MAIAVQCLPLYGVLTKTLHTAQAHFAFRHASVKHKNKLTENAKTALYPRGPSERKEKKTSSEFPLFHSAFYGRSLEEDQANNTVCLSIWPLSYLSSTSTDYCRDTKMRADQVCRLSYEFSRRLNPAVDGWNLSIREIQGWSRGAVTSSPSVHPLLLLFFNWEVFSLSGQIEARRSWRPGSPQGPTDSPTVTAGWVCQSGRAGHGLEGGGACIINPWQ